MPYIDEHKLSEIQKRIETLDLIQKELRQKNEALKTKTNQIEATENLLEEKTKALKKKITFQNILLSLITGISLAFGYYFYNNSEVTVNTSETKPIKTTHVPDKINVASANTSNNDFHKNNDDIKVETDIDTDIASLKNGLVGEKIYSVQIGVFNKKEYKVLSETLAGTISKGEIFKYSIGLFKTLKEAQDFRRELVEIGFNDAFVASYINGKRQAIEKPN